MPPVVLIDGTGDVSRDLVMGENNTNLQIAANGEPQVSRIVIRDIGGYTSRSFVTGKRVTVHVDTGPDPDVEWAGYVAKVGRQFWFDVDKPDTLNRRWVLTVVDINTLFTKRFAFKQSDPTNTAGPVYLSPTYDDTIIDELLANWLDLSADDLDVSSLVDRVAIVNPSVSCSAGQAFRPWSAGMSWGDAMLSVAQVPGAIFSLVPAKAIGSSPFARLMYADVESGVAPHALSDRRDLDADSVGYRECTIWQDGTDLANDALCWGAGKGTNQMVFDRIASSSSIAEHGLWQQGQTLFDVWCKDTIDAVADSIVFGSPSSKRGHKDDIRLVEVTVDRRIGVDAVGYKIGQRVRFISHEYDVDEVLPIRSIELDFPGSNTIRYKMKLSDLYDRWGFSDPIPPFRGGGGGGVGQLQTPCSSGFVVDDFNRTTSGFGTASSGSVYVFATPAEELASAVDGSKGRFTVSSTPPNQRVDWTLPTPAAARDIALGEFELSYVWEVPPESNLSGGFGPEYFGYLSVTYASTRTAAVQLSLGSLQAVLRVGTNSEDDLLGSNIIGGIPHIQNTFPLPSTAFVPGDVWHIKLGLSILGGWVGGKVWKDGNPEPGWQNTIVPMADFGASVGSGSTIRSFQQPSIASGSTSGSGFWDELGENCANLDPGVIGVPGFCGNPGDVVSERPMRLSTTQYQSGCSYEPNSIRVYRNGILQRDGTDYFETDFTTGLFDFVTAVPTADKITASYITLGTPA